MIPEEDGDSIANYLHQEQQVVDFKNEYFMVFIKFKFPYDIAHIFEDIETTIRVTIRHNHSTTLTTRGGYIGRVHQLYGLKVKYEAILNKCYFEEHGENVEINVRKSYFGEGVQALGIFIDKDKSDQIKETFVKKWEELIAQGVYVVPTGNYADKQAITYKLNMLKYQQQLNTPEKLNRQLLSEFHCDQMVQGCEFPHTVKAHLIMLKAKDGLPLLLAVEYVKPQGGASCSMLHYLKTNDPEILDLVNCKEFWTKLGVMRPSTNQRRMFKLPLNAVECKQNWNFTATPVEDILLDLIVSNNEKKEEKEQQTYAAKAKVGM